MNEVEPASLKSSTLRAVMFEPESIGERNLNTEVTQLSMFEYESCHEDVIEKTELKDNYQREENKDEWKHSTHAELSQVDIINHDLMNLKNECKDKSIIKVECCQNTHGIVVPNSFSEVDCKFQKNSVLKSKKTITLEKKNNTSTKKSKHKNYEKPSDQVLKVYRCTLCPKVFQRVKNFNSHQRNHNSSSKTRPYSCQDCKNTFLYRCQLRDHVRVHTGERPFNCHHCGKTFARKGCLISHMVTHSDALPYECATCHKRFARKYNLAKHLQSHSGERPYRCVDCSRRFKCKQSLDKHLRIHELSIYSCPVCQTTFDSKRRLTNHKTNEHVSYRPFLCQVCQKPFIFKSQLTYHIKEHNLERPYSCLKCKKSYFKKGHLLAHIKQYCSDSDNESETLVKHEISI